MGSTTQGWTRTLDRVLFGCAALILTTQLVGVASAAAASESGTQVAVAGVGIVTLVLIGLCAHGLHVGRRPAPAVLASIAAVVGVTCAVLAVGRGGLPEFAVQLLPTNALQALQIVAVAFVGRPILASALVAATGPVFVAAETSFAGHSALEAVDAWVLPASSSVAIIVAIAILRASGVRADIAAAEMRSASARAAAAASREAAADEVRRLVHDDVITALRAVELSLPRAQVERSARAALSRLQAAQHSDDVNRAPGAAAPWIRELAASASVAVELTDLGWPVKPPARVLDAMAAAAGEALRNVARHAGVDRATLVLHHEGNQCVVEVRDRGGGIEADSDPGFGIAQSIIKRMQSVGGAADIESGPKGTNVRLAWPATAGDTQGSPSLRIPIEFDRRQGYLLVAAAPIAANLYLAARFPGASLGSGMAVALACSLFLVAAAMLLGRRPATPTETLALGAIAPLIVWTGLTVAPTGALLSVESWVVGFAAVGLALIALESRPFHAALTCAGEVVTVVVFAWHDPSVGVFAPVGAIVTPVVVVGLGIAMGMGLRRGRATIARADAVLVAQAEDRAWRAGVAESRQTHLAHLQADVVPFLQGVLTGQESDARAIARMLGDLCRDDLHLQRPLPRTTRDQIRRARERGVTVTIREAAARHGLPEETWPALEAVLSLADDHNVITVLPPRRAGDPTRIVILPPLPHPLPGATTDGFRTTVEVSPKEPTSCDGAVAAGMAP